MVAQGTGHRRKLTVPMWGDQAEAGQSSVEFVALLPMLLLIALAMGQGAIAGYTAWSAAGAARVGARAQALGHDPTDAVHEVLPRLLLERLRVQATTEGARAGRVVVQLRVPSIVPGLKFGTVRRAAQLPDQVGA